MSASALVRLPLACWFVSIEEGMICMCNAGHAHCCGDRGSLAPATLHRDPACKLCNHPLVPKAAGSHITAFLDTAAETCCGACVELTLLIHVITTLYYHQSLALADFVSSTYSHVRQLLLPCRLFKPQACCIVGSFGRQGKGL